MSLTLTRETIEFFPQASIGEVEQTITLHKRGRVRFMATSWLAQFQHPNERRSALPGASVLVVGREGTTLLVRLVDSEPQIHISSRPNHSWLFRFACKVLKYFLLGLFGLLIALLWSGIMGFPPLTNLLISLLEYCFMKSAALVLCIVAMAVVIESAR
jgi:hypothetical protein